MGGTYRCFRVFCPSAWNFIDCFLGGRILDCERFARETGYEFTVDEHLGHLMVSSAKCALRYGRASDTRDSSNLLNATSINSRVIINGGSMRITSGLLSV